MKTRDVYLINGQTLNDSDTVTQDVTRGLKILYLIVQYSATNGATSNTLARLNSMVSKLAIIDGSDIKHSLSMREEQAWNFYMYGQLPYQSLSQAAAAVVVERAVIDFRRSRDDKNFYLDTSGMSNPQIQLTHNLTISATAGFATGSGKVTVIARVIDADALPNQGFVMAKELDSFASAASGDHTTDLPLDFPLSHILVLNPVNAKTPDNSLSNFKLTADTDAFIPINESYADLLRRNYDDFGEAYQDVNILTDTTYTDECDLYYHTGEAVIQGGATAKLLTSVVAANEMKGTMTTGESGTISIRETGSAPHSSTIYQFGDGYDPADVFNPAGVGKFQLKLTSAATGATPKVVTVQQHN
jgi:hypothetical protein